MGGFSERELRKALERAQIPRSESVLQQRLYQHVLIIEEQHLCRFALVFAGWCSEVPAFDKVDDKLSATHEQKR
jgi:hypothetical protein